MSKSIKKINFVPSNKIYNINFNKFSYFFVKIKIYKRKKI